MTKMDKLNVISIAACGPWTAPRTGKTTRGNDAEKLSQTLSRPSFAAIGIYITIRFEYLSRSLCPFSFVKGYHDVVTVMMLVLQDDQLAFLAAEKLSVHYLADFMQVDFKLLTMIMKLLFVLIAHQDSELFAFISEFIFSSASYRSNHFHADSSDRSGIEPFFALSWLITWFGHDIKTLDVIARIYDVLLCSHPSFVLYLTTAVSI